MVRYAWIVLAALTLAACAPAADPVLQRKIDTYYSQPAANTVPASGTFSKTMAYAVGQYVVHGLTDASGRSIMKTAIVGRQQGGWIIETHSITGASESAMQMLVTGLEATAGSGDMEGVDILWVRIKDRKGRIQTIDGAILQFAKGMYRQALTGMSTQITTIADGGTIAVPAGKFSGTGLSTTRLAFMGKVATARTWFHPRVPVNGVVKSISSEDNTVLELIEFGQTGARKSF